MLAHEQLEGAFPRLMTANCPISSSCVLTQPINDGFIIHQERQDDIWYKENLFFFWYPDINSRPYRLKGRCVFRSNYSWASLFSPMAYDIVSRRLSSLD
jgi:hypothetical protein